MKVKYICKVYRVRSSGGRNSEIKYPARASRIKNVDISDSIIIDIDKEWGVFKEISK